MAAAAAALPLGLGLLALAAWRPAPALALLALAIPLTAGLPRGFAVPLLRVNEELLLLVAAGAALHLLLRRRPRGFTGLDVVVLGFCAVNVLVASAVILLTRAPAAVADWLVVAGPLQYLVVYLLFSRAGLAGADLRLVLNLCMLASIPVAAVAVAETLDLPGVRDLVGALYPGVPAAAGEVYRPDSLLGHYSAVGAFGLLNLVLALALAATRHPGFSPWWLAAVVGANLLSLVSSQTYAPLLALPLAAGIVLACARRLPWRELAGGLPVLGAAAVLLWPSISGRVAAQFSGAGGPGGFGVPETLLTRMDYWQGLFVPALLRHGPWLGTGTLIPAEVPRPLVEFVDNGYLAELFRAGVPGLAAMLTLLGAVAAAGWAARGAADPSRRVLGAVCLAAVVTVLLLDVTAEYLTFTAVSQELWMLVGLLGGTLLAPAGGRALVLTPAPRRWRVAGALRRLAGSNLAGPAAVVALGFGVARALGLLFQVSAGRLLSPDGYGSLLYALAVANVAAVLLTTAPLGLSRFLARTGDTAEREAQLANWLAVVGILLGASAAVTAVAAGPAGLGGWMLPGLLANLLGAAALETYREVQRGLGRHALQAAFYVLANVLQLAAIALAAALGARSPALFLAIYGLAPVAALMALAPVGLGPRLARAALDWRRMLAIAGFLRPLLLQAVLWNAWFNADLLLVQHLRSAAETGEYAAAKTIANGFTLVPMALAFVLTPRVAQMAEREVRRHVLRALALTAAATVPAAVAVALLAGPLTVTLFGPGYVAAALPLAVLAAGMVAHGLRTVLDGMWLGLGRPAVEAAASAAGVAVTLGLGLWLVPAGGTRAAAFAFGAGALAQLLVDGGAAAWRLGPLDGAVAAARVRRLLVNWRGLPRRLLWGSRTGYLPRRPDTAAIVAVEAPAHPAPPPGPPAPGPVAVVADEPGATDVVLAMAARLLGLPVVTAAPDRAAPLVHRALARRWPLLSLPAAVAARLSEPAVTSLGAYLQAGGTLLLDGLDERANGDLARLGGRLGTPLPEVCATPPARRHRFPTAAAGFAAELAGTRLEAPGGDCALRPAGAAEVLLLREVPGAAPLPALVRQRAGRGHIVCSALARTSRQRLPELLTSRDPVAPVAALLLLRERFGRACWHAPAPVANFSIDDPALRGGVLGLPYDRLVSTAREHRFHVTIATVPRELALADTAVAALLRERRDALSACYHGCDHDGYEFFVTQGARLRHAPRPLVEQRLALRRAVGQGARFAQRHGQRLDRVMVFPYGVCPAALLPDLDRLGFLASCNYGDKYPLEAPVPADPDLGLRPADLAWEGFPLLWRRGLDDAGLALDLLLGRPLLVFAHRRDLGRDLAPFVERAEAIGRMTGGAAVWCSLEEVARHALLQRQGADGDWEVLMTGNEACLHNPDPLPRHCSVTRPHLPAGRVLAADGPGRPGSSARGLPALRVVVPPGGRAVVRVVPV